MGAWRELISPEALEYALSGDLYEKCPYCNSECITDKYGCCENCGQDRFDVTIEDEEIFISPAQLEGLKKGRRTGWNNKDIKGNIGEMWYANKLRNEGYKVRKTMYFDYDLGISVFNEKGIMDLLKEYPKRKSLMKLLKSFHKGYPDLICLKDGLILFYEVKTNNSQIKEHQQFVIDILSAKGFDVFTKILKVSFEVNE